MSSKTESLRKAAWPSVQTRQFLVIFPNPRYRYRTFLLDCVLHCYISEPFSFPFISNIFHHLSTFLISTRKKLSESERTFPDRLISPFADFPYWLLFLLYLLIKRMYTKLYLFKETKSHVWSHVFYQNIWFF